MGSEAHDAWTGGCRSDGFEKPEANTSQTEGYSAPVHSSYPLGFNTSVFYTNPNDFVVSSSNNIPQPNSGYGHSVIESTQTFDPASFPFEGSTISPSTYLPNNIAVPCHPSRRLPREGWTPDEDNLLVQGRKEGQGFSQIAKEMLTKHGVARSENCLVKRLQKIQGQYLEPLPLAVQNGMPEVMKIVKDEIEKLGLDGVSSHDQEVLKQVMQDLPRILPKFVQNRVTSTRKTLLNTSLSRS